MAGLKLRCIWLWMQAIKIFCGFYLTMGQTQIYNPSYDLRFLIAGLPTRLSDTRETRSHALLCRWQRETEIRSSFRCFSMREQRVNRLRTRLADSAFGVDSINGIDSREYGFFCILALNNHRLQIDTDPRMPTLGTFIVLAASFESGTASGHPSHQYPIVCALFGTWDMGFLEQISREANVRYYPGESPLVFCGESHLLVGCHRNLSVTRRILPVIGEWACLSWPIARVALQRKILDI